MGPARDGGAGGGGEWGGEVRDRMWVSKHGGFKGVGGGEKCDEGDKGCGIGGMEDAADIEDGAGRWTA